MIFSEATQRRLRSRDGVEVTYWLHQTAAPRGLLLLLHGAASNHTRWAEFLAATSLTDRWNVICPDLRGHGESPTRGDLSLPRLCDDLLQLIDTQPPLRVVIIGHSLGANLALHFAARHVERVSALVLIDPVQREITTHPVQRAFARGALWFVLRGVNVVNACGVRRRDLPELDLARLDVKARALIAAGREADMKRRYSSTFEDLKYFPVAVYVQDVLNVLEPLPVPSRAIPSLMLLSTSGNGPEVDNNRALARRLAQCTLVEIPCNHWILTVAPDAARRAIEDYLATAGDFFTGAQ